jgi:hypothetical protein
LVPVFFVVVRKIFPGMVRCGEDRHELSPTMLRKALGGDIS